MASPNPNPNPWGELFRLLVLLNLASCAGCRRQLPTGSDSDWLIRVFLSVPIAAKCPDCQTPEERAEVAIRQATDARRFRLEGFRLVKDGPTKPEGDPEEPEDGSQN